MFPTIAQQELKVLLGSRLDTSRSVRQHHAQDESFHLPATPDAVAFPVSTVEVAEIVRICLRHHLPIVPFGTGTAMEGGVAATQGGLCVDTSRMNAVTRVSVDDMDCTVQAGVTRCQLNEYLRDQGVFFPIDPGADASLGGMAATRASGTNAVRYGTMREVVLSLTVVTAQGDIVTTSTRARKSAAGYDLTRLFVGSEGTLGIICELTLRLFAIPEAISAAVCAFPDVQSAVQTAIATIQMGIPIARIELLDAVAIDAVNRYSQTAYPPQPHLFLEFHGSTASVSEQAESVQRLAEDEGAEGFCWALETEARNRIWQARHSLAYAVRALRSEARIFTTDVCVPLSHLAECIDDTAKDIATVGLPMAIVGHVGDGNFHVVAPVLPQQATELAQLEAFHGRLIRRALKYGGSCTGEHGIGVGKKAYLLEELPTAVVLMRTLKKALDPDNLMNPGKVLDMS